MNLIGCSGYAESGKDLVGKIIQHLTSDWSDDEFRDSDMLEIRSEWQIKKFSYKLKEIASLLTGIPKEKFENQEFKKSLLPEEWNHETTGDGFQVRKFLQFLGTNCIRDRLHENAWVNALFSGYIPHKKEGGFARTVKSAEGIPYDYEYEIEYPSWIITDCRFENEAEAIKQRGGIIIRINRENKVLKEWEAEAIKRGIIFYDNKHPSETSLDDWGFDYIIDNSGTVEELIENVRKMLIHFKIIENA